MSTRIKTTNAAAVVAYFADRNILVTVGPVTNYSLRGGRYMASAVRNCVVRCWIWGLSLMTD